MFFLNLFFSWWNFRHCSPVKWKPSCRKRAEIFFSSYNLCLGVHLQFCFSKFFPFLFPLLFELMDCTKSSTLFFMTSMAIWVCTLRVEWQRQYQWWNIHVYVCMCVYICTHIEWSFLSWGLPIIAKYHAFQFSFLHFFRVHDVFADHKPLHISGCYMLCQPAITIYQHPITMFHLTFALMCIKKISFVHFVCIFHFSVLDTKYCFHASPLHTLHSCLKQNSQMSCFWNLFITWSYLSNRG